MLSKGSCFLPEYSYSGLKMMYKHEKNPKAKIRLQACMMRKKGKGLQDIADEIEYPFTTIGDWLRRIEKEGFSRIYSKKQPGKKAYLTKDQEKEVVTALGDLPTKQNLPYKIWTTKILGKFIEKKFNVSYSLRRLEELVHKYGFNFKKARPEHKKANKQLQEAFKKTSRIESDLICKVDGRSFFLMKAYSK